MTVEDGGDLVALLTRLVKTPPAERDRLVRLVPGYRRLAFIDALLAAAAETPELQELAHAVLRVTAPQEPEHLARYANLTFDWLRQLPAGDARVETALSELEQLALRDGHAMIAAHVQWWRLDEALDRGDRARIDATADALAIRCAEIAAEPEEVFPTSARKVMANHLYGAARSGYYAERDPAAVLRLTTAARRLADLPEPTRLSAIVHMRLGQHELARDALRRLVDTGEASGMDAFNLGSTLTAIPGATGAAEAFALAVSLVPGDALYALHHASALADEGRLDEADAAARRALPVCARMVLEDDRVAPVDRRRFSGKGKERRTLREQILTMRVIVLDQMRTHDRPDLARRQAEDLMRDEDEPARLAGRSRMSLLQWEQGEHEAALQGLDALIEEGLDAAGFLALGARWRWDLGRTDEALRQLERAVRLGEHAEDVEALLREMRAAMPGHEGVRKALGCLLAIPGSGQRAEALALLEEIPEAEPSDALALFRRGLARCCAESFPDADRPSMPEDLHDALKDIGTAAVLDPQDAEIRLAWLWLVDRLACEPLWLGLITELTRAPWGATAVSPAVAQALRDLRDTKWRGVRKRHREAATQLTEVQARLRAEGLLTLAMTCHLWIADNLIRLHELEEAGDHLAAYDRGFDRVCYRPLSPALRPVVEQMQDEHAGSLAPVRTLDMEFMHVQTIAATAYAVNRTIMKAELLSRLGRARDALAVIEPLERELLEGDAGVVARVLPGAENIAILLREAGEHARALAVIDKARPLAQDLLGVKLDFFRGTLLMAQDREPEAIDWFEAMLARTAEDEAHRDGLLFNLAELHARQDRPGRALELLAPVLAKPRASDRFALIIESLAMRIQAMLERLDLAVGHAREVLAAFFRMRDAFARIEDRQQLAGEHGEQIDLVLRVLVMSKRPHEVFAAVESLRARSWEELRLHRSETPGEQDLALDGQIDRLDRMDALLRRLRRGLERLGPDYRDTVALARLRDLDPKLSLFEREPASAPDPEPGAPDRARVRSESIDHYLTLCETERTRLQRERDRRRRAGAAAAPTETTPAMLSQALATASADGPRCVFVQMLVFGRTLAILRVASDDPEPRLSASIQLPDELPSLDELAADPNLPDMLDDGLGRALAAAVVDPLLADIAPGDRVVLCTTAPASRVPWHALPLADGRPWGARNVISQAPNATVLVRCLSQARPDGAALVIGDPTGDLPRGRDEARAIAEALGVTPLLGGEATLGAVAAALAGQAPALLHFACHGDVDEVDSTRSALLLAPEDPSDDGRLTVTALGGAALAGTRAFLSACDLAVADGPTRTEVFGMPRALLAAGAGAVVAGIWRVDDTATQLLMQRCHRDMATQPLADALASAQHWLRGLTVADVVAMAEAALAAELPQDRRARLLRHIAVEQVRAGDLPAAGATLRRLLADTDEDLAPAEHAQARHYLALLADVGDPLAPPDYAMRPFAPMRLWAPFVVTGDWR